jgi:hypothetical protein
MSRLLLLSLTAIFLLPAYADDLSDLARLRSYTMQRITSSDESGGNADGAHGGPVKPGETRTIGEVQGPGIIKHIWMTIATREPWHLKKCVMRIYWDGAAEPAVETPAGDFFGLGLGHYFTYESGPISVGSQKALNAYFPMPFRRSAKITFTNEGDEALGALYYNIDWEKHARLPEDLGYFHAEYRQAVPNKGVTDDWEANRDVNPMKNLDGKENYVFFETEGRGHYVGVTLSILQNQGDWWGEGDEMIYVDDMSKPVMTGTGSEDYFLGAWCYGGCGISPFGFAYPTFAYERYGNPMNGGDMRGAQWMVYRFHTDSPIPFEKSFKISIEHGHANHRSDNFYSTAYWYQTTPTHKRVPLPSVAERIPRLVNTGGPTVGK